MTTLRGSGHKCRLPGCETFCAPSMLLCGAHWRMVPVDLKRRVWAHYRQGQEADLAVTAEYLDAARAAVAAVKEMEEEGGS